MQEIKQDVPEGFIYYGLGPIKSREGDSFDVCLWNKRTASWDNPAAGDSANLIYALRVGSEIARLNGLEQDLPPGLPPLPPLPEGYCRWEYRGKGWKAKDALYDFCEDGETTWWGDPDGTGTGEPLGAPDFHYIEAIKSEAIPSTPSVGEVKPEPKVIDDGGPAFPATAYKDDKIIHKLTTGGISVRLWLAGQAMQGLISGPIKDADYLDYPDCVAADALKFADAMIAADKQPTGKGQSDER